MFGVIAMARKHFLPSLATDPEGERRVPSASRADYVNRGASRSMIQSLDEMAEASMRLLEGEAVISLDPACLEDSPFADRLGDDDAEFENLVEAIRSTGQMSPILVRPHPERSDRYIIIYGHRRARAAMRLGQPVRAIVKPLEDIHHLIAQGQENTARMDLSFIEKAVFASKLSGSGISKDHIKKALSIDDTLLSRMLSVIETVPHPILDAVGAARGIGRDRWELLKKLVQKPSTAEVAISLIKDGTLERVEPHERFAVLLKQLAKRHRPAARRGKHDKWSIARNAVQVESIDAGRSFTLAMKSEDASAFGTYLSRRLEQLYREFQTNPDTES